MERGVGLNVLLSYCSDPLRTEIGGYVASAKPAAMLYSVRDQSEEVYIKWLQAHFGAHTAIVYRLWIPNPANPNEGDNQHLWLTPEEWVNKHRAFANTGVWCEMLNEPNPLTSIAWLMRTMSLAWAAGIRTSAGAYAYGQPIDHTDYRAFDPMLKLINSSRGMGRVSLHEYVLGGTALNDVVGVDPFNPATWPSTVPKSQRWTLGRYQWWIEDAASRGIPFPDFFVTEWGWATRPDMPHEWIRNVAQTWPVADREAFMAQQLKWAWKTLYRPSPKFKGAMLFTLNDGGQWDFSNYLHFPRARDLMREGFDLMTAPTQPPTVPTFDPYPVGPRVLNIVDTRYSEINLRAADGSILTEIPDGATITVIAPDTARMLIGGRWYDVQKVRYGAHEGVIALTSTFNLDVIPVTPDTVTRAQLLAWADQLDAISADMRAKAATL